MKLKAKFNVVILAIFGVGLLVTGYLSNAILQANAQKDAIERAALVMEAATAMQAYTQAEVGPLLAAQMGAKLLDHVCLPVESLVAGVSGIEDCRLVGVVGVAFTHLVQGLNCRVGRHRLGG